MTFLAPRYDPSRPWPVPANTDDVTVMTADGVRLDAWFMRAAPPKTGLTVLFLHGNGDMLPYVTRDARVLQQRGFDVFAIDYRGYGRSEGTSLGERTLHLDGAAALHYLTGQRGIDPATIAIVGQSLGTTVAADLAVAAPCHAVVLMAPLASARAQAETMLPWLPTFLYRWMRSPFDTVGKIGRARCPVLVVHGDSDGTIALAQGLAVYAAARPPKKLIVVRGGGHVPSLVGNSAYVEDVVNFLIQPPSK